MGIKDRAEVVKTRVLRELNSPAALMIPRTIREEIAGLAELLSEMAAEVEDLRGLVLGE